MLLPLKRNTEKKLVFLLSVAGAFYLAAYWPTTVELYVASNKATLLRT